MTEATKWKRLIVIGTLGAVAGIFMILCSRIHITFLNLALLACIAMVWLGVTVLVWNRRPIGLAVLLLPFLVAISLFLPGRRILVEELRQDYVRRLTQFEGTEYHWGGESPRGIDCSGLPRKALRDALWAYGIRHGSGPALRSYVEQWWFDASAKALGEGYRDYTRPMEITGTIRKIKYDALMPGDLAVTSDGLHVLAYLGGDRWIQADPGIGAVATMDGRNDNNVWFMTRVVIHRWKLFVAP